jgi:thimet oligopeptidase
MFSRFNPADLLDPKIAKRYREAILSPGGSAPAEVLIQNFLGRRFNTNAWQSWLNTD